MNIEEVIQCTQSWIQSIVIDLNLCPFARKVADDGLIRFQVSDAQRRDSILADLEIELYKLIESPRESVETSFLILPNAFPDFLDFNDFLGSADDLLRDLQLRGVIQIVGFHPQFQFANTKANAVENYTNRSPYPMLHLLREESVTEVSTDMNRIREIPKRNTETLQRMGLKKIQDRLKAILRQAHAGE